MGFGLTDILGSDGHPISNYTTSTVSSPSNSLHVARNIAVFTNGYMSAYIKGTFSDKWRKIWLHYDSHAQTLILYEHQPTVQCPKPKAIDSLSIDGRSEAIAYAHNQPELLKKPTNCIFSIGWPGGKVFKLSSDNEQEMRSRVLGKYRSFFP